MRGERVRRLRLVGLTVALAALAQSMGCVVPPPTEPPPDNSQNGLPNAPPTGYGSIAGQLTVQTDEEPAAVLTPGPAIPFASAASASLAGAAAGAKDSDAALRRQITTVGSAVEAASRVTGELLVTFDDGATVQQRRALLSDVGMDLVECSPSDTCRAAPAGVPPEDKSLRVGRAADAHARLVGQPGVRAVEPNPRRGIALAPNDPYYLYQWHYSAIHLPEAWDMIIGSDDVIVAVVDTGILSGHPDLQGRLVAGYDFIADPASARDGDGRDGNPEDQGDLFGGPGQSSFHGTHIAGTLSAATDNSAGVAGATWRTRVMPLRALGVNGGTAFDVSEAIRYAAGLPNVSGQIPPRRASVINLSLVGSPGEPPSLTELNALRDAAAAGLVIVGAAGNEGSSLPAYPAAAPEVISVSAVDIELQLAGYSNRGASIDLAAPGGFTGTDLNGDGFADGVLSTGGSDLGGILRYEYIFANGTSMAAPHVAAVAALVLGANPGLSAPDVRGILETTARDLGPVGRDDHFGSGLVDAAAAVREAYLRAGVTPTVTARLTVSNDTLNFGLNRDHLTVQLANSAGPLTIDAVSTRTGVGTDWLLAQADPVPPGGSVTNLLVTVNRQGLADGSYRGSVTVTASGLDPVTIEVLMAVGPPGVALETIYVLAVDPATRDTIGEAATQAAQSYVYAIGGLPAGAYVIYAGTDRDDDGYICEEGDLCGALPSRLEPATITLGESQNLTNIDFAVARLILQQQTGEPSAMPAPKRIR